jgi:pyruvate ferredoxin oxidoreductase gamma subunit
MYRVRFHGRGGQGMKTASRILGSAFFRSGFEVQDAPRYGAERRGAPMFAYVRAGRREIHERGVITRPDLVVVADDSLVASPAAGVTAGLDERTVLLIASAESSSTWQERLRHHGPTLALPIDPADAAAPRFVGPACAAAAARLVGVIAHPDFEAALREELAPLGERATAQGLESGCAAWQAFEAQAGLVREGPEQTQSLVERPHWIRLPFESAHISAPAIHAAATSVEVRTGLWRTVRPVIDEERCRHCTWICSTLCPDAAIEVREDGAPRIDLDHCKGCMVCVAVCPSHAIASVPERGADARDAEGGRS